MSITYWLNSCVVKARLNWHGWISPAMLVFGLVVWMGVGATLIFAQSSPPPLPAAFWGTLTIAGTPAPSGTEVCGYIQNVSKGCITTRGAGQYGGPSGSDSKLIVQGNDADVGINISFKVTPPGTVGAFAQQVVTYAEGDVREVDLALASQPAPLPTLTGTVTPETTLKPTLTTSPTGTSIRIPSSTPTAPTPTEVIQSVWLTPTSPGQVKTQMVLGVATISNQAVVSQQATGVDDQGNAVLTTGWPISFVTQERGGKSVLVLELPLRLASGRVLTSFADSVNGIVVATDEGTRNAVVTIPLAVTGEATTLLLRATTDSLDGLGTSAQGRVSKLELVGTSFADLVQKDPSQGRIQIGFALELSGVPQSSSIRLNIIEPSEDREWASIMKDMSGVVGGVSGAPYALQVTKDVGLQNVMKSATVSLTVGTQWLAERGLVAESMSVGQSSAQVVVFRWADDGSVQTLRPVFRGLSGGQVVFDVNSPQGLSVFALATLAQKMEPLATLTLTPALTTGSPPSPDQTSGWLVLTLAGALLVAAITGGILLRRRFVKGS